MGYLSFLEKYLFRSFAHLKLPVSKTPHLFLSGFLLGPQLICITGPFHESLGQDTWASCANTKEKIISLSLDWPQHFLLNWDYISTWSLEDLLFIQIIYCYTILKIEDWVPLGPSHRKWNFRALTLPMQTLLASLKSPGLWNILRRKTRWAWR